MYKGIDVSRYQGKIDWKKVKNSGIQFAMLRCGSGYQGGSKDIKFEDNYKGAKEQGIYVGAYFYSYAKTVSQAEKEADLVLTWLKDKQFEYPIAFDIEDNSQKKLGKQLISEIIKTFCNKLEKAGYFVSVYSSKSWFETLIDDEVKSKYDTWVAQWSDKCTYKDNYGIWQNSSKGSIKGINGNVDTDIAYKNYPNIMKNNSLNRFTKSNQVTIKKGDKVKVTNPINYDTGKKFKLWFKEYTVLSIKGERAVIGKLGVTTSAIHVKYLTKV